MNLRSKVNKLTLALRMKGYLYLVNKEQFYSEKLNKICTVNKLINLMPVEEYNRKYPDKKKDAKKYKFVKVEILKSYSFKDILIRLAEIYKEVSNVDG